MEHTTEKTEKSVEEGMQFRDAVRMSAQQIWQAGLGAFAAARGEGGGLFSRLMQEGAGLQARTGQSISDVVARMTETIGKQAAGPLGKVEEAFEERLTRTLRNFGVPTKDDLNALTQEIEKLRKTIVAVSAGGAKAKKNTAAKGKEKTALKSTARQARTRGTPAKQTPLAPEQA